MSSNVPSTQNKRPGVGWRALGWFRKYCIHDCCDFHRAANLKDEPINVWGLFQVISVKFLLEVAGAAGAIWGTSEVVLLRHPSTNELWRRIAMLVGLVFSVRFWWHAKHFYRHEHDFPPIKEHHRRIHRLPFVQIFSSKFILEVMGGTGAIWGCSDACSLRNATNETSWRIAAVVVGTMFGIRFILQILSYCLYFASLWTNPSSILMTTVRWYEILIVKLILEVFGAAGATWGFSEVVFLRTPQNLAFWRPLAISMGVVFLVRWLRQVYSFIQDERQSVHTTDLVQPKDTLPEEVQDLDLEISDLALAEPSPSN